jgi:hypothetical protein
MTRRPQYDDEGRLTTALGLCLGPAKPRRWRAERNIKPSPAQMPNGVASESTTMTK